MNWMPAAVAAFFVAFAPAIGDAQIIQQNKIVPGHASRWVAPGLLGDGGGIAGGKAGTFLSEIGTTNPGFGYCQNSGPITAPYRTICLGFDGNNAELSLDSHGAAIGTFELSIGGVKIPFPGIVSGLQIVPSNADLRLLPSGAARLVVRLDYADGIGSPPIFYKSSATPCSLNGGAGDGGSQVRSADGLCWLADLEGVRATPKIWGAVGDGVADDRAAVQAAILAQAGKALYLGPYRYKIGAPGLVSYKPIRLTGDTSSTQDLPTGQQYGLIAGDVNINLLTLSGDGGTTASGSVLDSLYLDTRTAGVSTTGAALVNYGTFGVEMQHLRMNIGCIGLDEQLSVVDKFDGGSIRSGGVRLPSGCGGIRVGHASTGAALTDFHITNTHIDANGDYSLLVEDGGGLFINGSDFLFSQNGVSIRPGSSQAVVWLTATNSYLSDTTCNAGLTISPASPLSIISNLHFTQTWTSSAGTGEGCNAPGVLIDNAAGGIVKGVHFLGHRAFGNSSYGMIINAGVTDVTVDASEICNNSIATATVPATSYDGIVLGDGASGVAIRNNRIAANCAEVAAGSTYQRYGVAFNGLSSDMTVIGNDMRGSAGSPIIFGVSPTGATIIRDNTGIDTVGVNIADAAAITVPINPIINLTGSGTTISTINGMWDGREMRAFIRDGANTFASGGAPGTDICSTTTFPQFSVVTLYKVPGANCISVK